jgi:hypothetical protein
MKCVVIKDADGITGGQSLPQSVISSQVTELKLENVLLT